MKKHLLKLASGLFALLFASAAFAAGEVISIANSMSDTTTTEKSGLLTDTTLRVENQYWNSLGKMKYGAQNFSLNTLKDNSGQVMSETSISGSCGGWWYYDAKAAFGEMGYNYSEGPWSVKVLNIPYKVYDLIIYYAAPSDADVDQWGWSSVGVTSEDGKISYYIPDTTDTASATTSTEITATTKWGVRAPTEHGYGNDVIRISGLTNPILSFTNTHNTTDKVHGGVFGFQIVNMDDAYAKIYNLGYNHTLSEAIVENSLVSVKLTTLDLANGKVELTDAYTTMLSETVKWSLSYNGNPIVVTNATLSDADDKITVTFMAQGTASDYGAVTFDVSPSPVTAYLATPTETTAYHNAPNVVDDVIGKTATIVKVTGDGGEAVNIYGAFRDETGTGPHNGDIWLKAEKGCYNYVVGGSYGQYNKGNKDVNGNIVVELGDSATANHLFGAGLNANNPNVVGDVKVIAKGIVKGSIIGGWTAAHNATANVTGNTYVKVTAIPGTGASNVNSFPNDLIVGAGAHEANTISASKVSGNSTVEIVLGEDKAGDFARRIIGGGFANSSNGSYSDYTVGGDTAVNITAPTGVAFTKDIVGGTYRANAAFGNTTTVANSSVMINGGSYSKKIVAGGYTGVGGTSTVTGAATLTIKAGAFNTGTELLPTFNGTVGSSTLTIDAETSTIDLRNATIGKFGAITVKSGTLHIASTQEDVLPSITVKAGAKLYVTLTSDEVNSSYLSQARIEEGGAISLRSPTDDAELSTGTTYESTSLTEWKGTSGGDWDDVGNWSKGIPSESLSAKIVLSSSMTINLPADAKAKVLQVVMSGVASASTAPIALTLEDKDGAEGSLTVSDATYLEVNTDISAVAATLGAVALDDGKTLIIGTANAFTSLDAGETSILATKGNFTYPKDATNNIKNIQVIGGTLTTDGTGKSVKPFSGNTITVTGEDSVLNASVGDATGYSTGGAGIVIENGGKFIYAKRDTLITPFTLCGGTIELAVDVASSSRALDFYNGSGNYVTVLAAEGADSSNPTKSFITALGTEDNRKVSIRGGSLIFDVEANAQLTVDALIGHFGGDGTPGALIKSGDGVLELKGFDANSYTTKTEIQAGTLLLSDSATLGTGSVTVSAGSVLEINATAAKTIPNAFWGSGTIKLTGTAPVSLTGNFAGFTGTIEGVDGSSIEIPSGISLSLMDTTLDVSVTVKNGATLFVKDAAKSLVTVEVGGTLRSFLEKTLSNVQYSVDQNSSYDQGGYTYFTFKTNDAQFGLVEEQPEIIWVKQLTFAARNDNNNQPDQIRICANSDEITSFGTSILKTTATRTIKNSVSRTFLTYTFATPIQLTKGTVFRVYRAANTETFGYSVFTTSADDTTDIRPANTNGGVHTTHSPLIELTVCVSTYAAEIEGTRYASVDEALTVAGATPTTIKLLQDVTKAITIGAGQDITLNLNDQGVSTINVTGGRLSLLCNVGATTINVSDGTLYTTDATTFAGTTINFSGTGALTSVGYPNIAAATTLTVDVAEDMTVNHGTTSNYYQGFNGTGNFKKTGAGTFITRLKASGALAVEGGVLGLIGDNCVSGADTETSVILQGSISGTGEIKVVSGTVNLTGANGEYKGQFTVDANAILESSGVSDTLGYDISVPFGKGSIVNNGTVKITNSPSAGGFIPPMSGVGDLLVNKSVRLATALTISGTVTIADDQTLTVVKDATDFNGHTPSINGPSIELNGALVISTTEVEGVATPDGTVTIAATKTLSGVGTITGDVTFADTSKLDASDATADSCLTITGTVKLPDEGTATVTLPENVTADTVLLKASGLDATKFTAEGLDESLMLVASDTALTVAAKPTEATVATVEELAAALANDYIKKVTINADASIATALTLAEGKTLIIPEGVTVTASAGPLVISGTIEVYGTLNGYDLPYGETGLVPSQGGSVKIGAKGTVVMPKVWENAGLDPNTENLYVLSDDCEEGAILQIGDNEVWIKGASEWTQQVAKIGTTYYATLADAVAQGGEVTLLVDCAGEGIIISKEVTIDFNKHTYTVNNSTLAGSTGTKTICFQILKEAGDVTLKNGTIVGDYYVENEVEGNKSVKRLIQNYANLTLDGMTLDATAGNNKIADYACTFAAGTVTLTGGTTITAPTNGYAFDVYYWGAPYTAGVSVTLNDATINGKVEVATDQATLADGAAFGLTLTKGTITGDLVMGNGADKATVSKTADATVGTPDGYQWNAEGVLEPIPPTESIQDKIDAATSGVIDTGDATITVAEDGTITVGDETVTAPADKPYYSLAVTEGKLTLVLNDNAKPVIAATADESIPALEVTADGLKINVPNLESALKYQLMGTIFLDADKVDWQPVGEAVTGQASHTFTGGTTYKFFKIEVTDK